MTYCLKKISNHYESKIIVIFRRIHNMHFGFFDSQNKEYKFFETTKSLTSFITMKTKTFLSGTKQGI